jgi:hypothetical protein
MVEQDANALGLRTFIKHDWPYLAMFVLALVGVAFASIALDAMAAYWEVMVPFFAGVCVYARLRDAQHQAVLARLVRIEAFHWSGVAVAMWLLSIPAVNRMMDANAIGLMTMLVLALGTFTAGAQIGAWRIAIIGVILALAVPFVAWLERATLLVTLVGLSLVGLGAFFFAHHRQRMEAPRQT